MLVYLCIYRERDMYIHVYLSIYIYAYDCTYMLYVIYIYICIGVQLRQRHARRRHVPGPPGRVRRRLHQVRPLGARGRCRRLSLLLVPSLLYYCC